MQSRAQMGTMKQSESSESLLPPADAAEANRTWVVTWSSFVFAVLQSACAAVLALSGVRVAIGFSALAAAAGVNTPARGFHQDAIRIPMLLLSVAGAVINLYVLWH